MKCVTVSYGKVSGRAKQYHYVQPALYELIWSEQHLKYKWVYLEHLGRTRRSDKLALNDALEYSYKYNIPYIKNIRNNSPFTNEHRSIINQFNVVSNRFFNS